MASKNERMEHHFQGELATGTDRGAMQLITGNAATEHTGELAVLAAPEHTTGSTQVASDQHILKQMP
jgi:hypothetical protein